MGGPRSAFAARYGMGARHRSSAFPRNAFRSGSRMVERDETWFVSRDVAAAVPGDLLFFEAAGDSAQHVMIYVGPSQIVPSSRKWVVYLADSGREMEKVPLDALLAFPSADWRPRSENAHFLGVRRFNLLRDSR
jgi:uncharacterized protein YfaT (DUF1175 family)